MIQVFRLRPDSGKYARVVLRDPFGFRERCSDAFTGKPIRIPKEPIRCSVDDLTKPLADFSAFLPGSFVVLANVAHQSSRYEMCGQLIPVLIGSQEAYAINVTEVLNALDKSRSSIPAAVLSFHANRIGGSGLFKIPETARGDVLTYSGLLDEDDEFVGEYKGKALCGLEFDLIWSEQGLSGGVT